MQRLLEKNSSRFLIRSNFVLYYSLFLIILVFLFTDTNATTNDFLLQRTNTYIASPRKIEESSILLSNYILQQKDKKRRTLTVNNIATPELDSSNESVQVNVSIDGKEVHTEIEQENSNRKKSGFGIIVKKWAYNILPKTFKASMVAYLILWLIVCTIFSGIGPTFLWVNSLVPMVLFHLGMLILFLTQLRATRITYHQLRILLPESDNYPHFYEYDISMYLIYPLKTTTLGYLSTIILMISATSIQYPVDTFHSNMLANILNGIACLGLFVVSWVTLEPTGTILEPLLCTFPSCFQNDTIHLSAAIVAFGTFIFYQLIQTSANLTNLVVHHVFPADKMLWYFSVVIISLQIITTITTTAACLKWLFHPSNIRSSKFEWLAAIMIGVHYLLASFLTAFVKFNLHGERE